MFGTGGQTATFQCAADGARHAAADRGDQIVERGRQRLLRGDLEKAGDSSVHAHARDVLPAFDLDALDLIVARFLMNLDLGDVYRFAHGI
jgi:hypothetical protein